MSDAIKCSSSSYAGTAATVMPGSKLLCAAAPWLAAASRLVCSTATQFAACLKLQPKQGWAYAAEGSSSSSSSRGSEGVPAAHTGKQLVDDNFRLVKDCAEGLMYHALALKELLENWRDQHSLHTSSRRPGSTSDAFRSDSSSRDVDAVRDDDLAVTRTSTAAPNAVLDHQQSVLLEALHALETELVPNLHRLDGACDVISLQLPLLVTGAELSRASALFGPGAAAAAEEMLGVEAFDGIMTMLQHWGVRELLQQLVDVGQRVGAVLPSKLCCNNPSCDNVSGSSEQALVSGICCVCSGCDTARYCGRDCQTAHWPRHKAICKIIKKQCGAKQQG